ncbi:GtrA family protein, partial [Pseudonocardia sp. KRD291]|uniref:GtrA family protein n=1 Tax=Pseudonocardia sp. KRD291 TaxID=2792007 RepID=UPI001C4A4EE1
DDPGATDRGDGVTTGRLATWRRRHPTLVQLVRYAIIGGGSTGLTAVLFLALRPWFEAVPANLVALVVTTAVSTEANRRFAFGGARAHRLREWVQDIGTVAFYAGYTSAVLLVLHLLVPSASPVQEAVAVAVASVGGGIARFLVLRNWVFETHDGRAHS